MVATVDWADLTVAAAFVLGAAAGTIATTRIFRHAIDYLRREGEQATRRGK